MITIESDSALESMLIMDCDDSAKAIILYLGGFPAAIRYMEWFGETYYIVKKPLWKRDDAYTETVMAAFPGIEDVCEQDRDTFILRYARVAFEYEVMKTIRAGIKPGNYRESK